MRSALTTPRNGAAPQRPLHSSEPASSTRDRAKGLDKKVLEIINVLEDKPTSQRCLAERAFLRELEGGCQVPIGVNSKIDNEQLYLTGISL